MAAADTVAGFAPSASPPQEILSLRGVSKAFGHVQALADVDLELHRGEILGVVGDNGAGKSTLMKVIAGTVRPDAGSILVDGQAAQIGEAQDARRLGIEMIYQDLALFNNLSIAANVFIGREPTRGGSASCRSCAVARSTARQGRFWTGSGSASRPPSFSSKACPAANARWWRSHGRSPSTPGS